MRSEGGPAWGASTLEALPDGRETAKLASSPGGVSECLAPDGRLTKSLNRAAVPQCVTLPAGRRTLPYILFSCSVSLAGFETGNTTFLKDTIRGVAIWKSRQGQGLSDNPLVLQRKRPGPDN